MPPQNQNKKIKNLTFYTSPPPPPCKTLTAADSPRRGPWA